jgi:hypothetical protein
MFKWLIGEKKAIIQEDEIPFGDKPISQEYFKSIEDRLKVEREKKCNVHRKILDRKLEASKQWSEFALRLLKENSIPKDVISEVKISVYSIEELELRVPRVYLEYSYRLKDMIGEDKKSYEIFALQQDYAEHSIAWLIEHIRYIRKELDKELKDA